MTRALIAAPDMRPGLTFRSRGVLVTVLGERETRKDIFGRDMDAWLCRREDTGATGHMMLGPGGVFVDDERGF